RRGHDNGRRNTDGAERAQPAAQREAAESNGRGRRGRGRGRKRDNETLGEETVAAVTSPASLEEAARSTENTPVTGSEAPTQETSGEATTPRRRRRRGRRGRGGADRQETA